MRRSGLALFCLFCALPLVLSCGGGGGGDTSSGNTGNASASVPSPPPPPPPPPPPSPPPPAPVGLEGTFPAGLEIADSILRPDVDVPAFHFPTSALGHYNLQANFEADFPRLTVWAECLARLRAGNGEAICIVLRFDLIEIDAAGVERVLAGFDFSEQRRGRSVECGFTADDPPVRIDSSFCAGANYRRESDDGARLCWYNWCFPNQRLPDEGMRRMLNSEIDANGQLKINVQAEPRRVAHWWSQRWTEDEARSGIPHPRTNPTSRYVIDIEFRTINDAVLRVGADRWIETAAGAPRACSASQSVGANCQVYFSNWLRSRTGDTAFHRLRFRLTPPAS